MFFFFHRVDIMLIVKIFLVHKKSYKKTCLSYSSSVCIMASVQVSQQDISSLFFKHPSNIFISGPSGSGKTEFVKKKMIEYREDLFNILPLHIV